MSLGDVPKGAYTPPSLHGSADAAWGQDAEEASDADADTLMPLLSTSMKGPLPTVMEHFDEGIGMSRPQSLADLSKAGWTVDNALLQASANANISRMSRISSFPCLPTMVETVTDSTGGSPPPPWGFPAVPQGPADNSKPWGSAWDGLAPEPRQASTDAAQPSSLNPHAFSFQPGLLSTQLHHSTATGPPSPAVVHDTAEQRRTLRDMLASNMPSPAAAEQSQDAAAISPQLKPIVTSISPDKHAALTVDPADGFAQALEVRQKSVSIAELARQADKSVARRLLLKKRVPSFGKSKSCNDLAAAVPKSPTRSPLAPLGNFGQ